MIRKRLAILTAAAGFGVALSFTIDAALVAQGAESVQQQEQGMVVHIAAATTDFFEEFEQGKPAQQQPAYRLPGREDLAGAYALLTPREDGESRTSTGMILASLGLMALIVHRRRYL